MNVLLVEDDDATRELLRTLFRSRGHTVTDCVDAETALVHYTKQSYPLVILDWYLPGMDGLEFCRRVRATERSQRTVILVFTSADEPEHLRAALKAGADDYMAKPLEPSLLNVRITVAEQQVRNMVARHRAEQERDQAQKELESRNDDMKFILNGLRVGTVLLDGSGRITFISEAAQKLLATPLDEALGEQWQAVFPFSSREKYELERQLTLPNNLRTKQPAKVETLDGRSFSMELEIQDDPGAPSRKIVVMYDVTEVVNLRRKMSGTSFKNLIGASEPMQRVYQQIRQLARVDSTVLVEGETGTGKELVAQAIHASSARKDKAFVAINCAGLTESLVASQLFGHRRGAFTGAVEDHKGVFESAHQGTLFLDEIGDIPMSVQTSLLRVLQEREITRLGETKSRKIDVRVLTATHRNLAEEVEKGRVRMDLLYRIRVARIQLPPLRERRRDIPILAAHFLDEFFHLTQRTVQGISPDAMQVLMTYSWPGNVRELRGAMESAIIRCQGPVIQRSDLPPEIAKSVRHSFGQAKAPDDERALILEALEAAKGNRSAAAKALGVSRATFYRRLEALDINLRR